MLWLILTAFTCKLWLTKYTENYISYQDTTMLYFQPRRNSDWVGIWVASTDSLDLNTDHSENLKLGVTMVNVLHLAYLHHLLGPQADHASSGKEETRCHDDGPVWCCCGEGRISGTVDLAFWAREEEGVDFSGHHGRWMPGQLLDGECGQGIVHERPLIWNSRFRSLVHSLLDECRGWFLSLVAAVRSESGKGQLKSRTQPYMT